NEIHPDYYQIPHADREALLREAESDDDDASLPPPPSASANGAEDGADELGGDDEDEMDEEVARRRRRLMRRYKIQEVIKRRQIMLVQVVKEERGNKGAALTTYLSLAGRYCVLMPNTDRGGGISRKITAVTDRKRLRSIVADFDVPEGMGLIVRTAGAKRTKAEIKRDYEYLSRAWTNIRDTTLHSVAPALIYEEEDLVKRAIRDLFDKDIDGIWVEGEAGFREARDFMRMLMPSQAKKIQYYRGAAPLFVAHKIEDHLAQIYSPTVPLKSGGYLVINQTEALVAVDVNSGRATRERNIEATALKTNLEAAEETARQLRLRDLAGLVIIDFIDMDEAKNNRAVEKTLKDALAHDRARIQMGRISSFGLMEISRQRRRTGILEGTTHICPHCGGAGRVRSVESSALAALRAVEMEALSGGGEVIVRVPRDVGLYILNNKREYLTRLLRSHGLFVSVVIDEALAHADHEIERTSSVPHEIDRSWEAPDLEALDDEAFDDIEEDEENEEDEAILGVGDAEDVDLDDDDDEDDDEEDLVEEAGVATALDDGARYADEDGSRRRGGRRRRRGRRGDEVRATVEPSAPAPAAANGADGDYEGDGGGRRRRRGRRGGRRVRDEGQAADVYAWSWPARLSGEDPYEWRGAIRRPEPQEFQSPEPQAQESAPAAPMAAEAPRAQAADSWETAISPLDHLDSAGAPAFSKPLEDAWVELPEASEKPARSRRSRGRNRGGAPEAEVAGEVVQEAVTEIPPEPETSLVADAEALVEPLVEARAAEPEALAPAAPEPEVAPAPAPVPPPEPVLVGAGPEPEPAVYDPAEISTPPAAPRRGWWRRGT
ncbi:MAG TPA: ribonuclease E/G, partial [Caulobacteraceae bacterium]|nr:ribonuclease E/G [Caulobacteraceae bacterium]